MNVKATIVFLLITVFCACNNSDSKKSSQYKTGAQSNSSLVTHLEPNLVKADCIQVLYYDDPDGDSLRYSRFFTYLETNDSNTIKRFLQVMDQRFEKQDHKKDCRSEGKLFLLNKEEVLKTIYFSTNNDGCSYMYFIKDGAFIYFNVTANARKFFIENKKLAKKPA